MISEVVAKHHPGPMVTLRIVSPVGSSSDAISGLAHFAEHMAFKGTNAVPLAEFNQLSARLGVFNAYTHFDRVVYWCICLPADAEDCIDLLSEMVFRASYPEEEVEKEKTVICEEISAYQASPINWFYWQMQEGIWGNGYGHFQAGTQEDVLRTTRDDLFSWKVDSLESPDIPLIACGDISDALIAKAESLRFDRTGLTMAPFPSQWMNRPLRFSHPSPQAHVAVVYRGVSYADEIDSSLVSDIAASIIGGDRHSLLWPIRDDLGLCYSIGCFHASFAAHGYLAIKSQLASENVTRCFDEIQKCIRTALRGGFSDEQLETAKKSVARNVAFGRLSASSLGAVGDSYFSRSSKAWTLQAMDTERLVRNILALTRDDVQEWISTKLACPGVPVVMYPEADIQQAKEKWDAA